MRPEMTRRQSARRPESGPVKRGFLRPGALCSLAAAAVLAFAGAGTAVAQPSGGPGAPAARATTASSGSAGSSNSTARLSDGTVVDSAAAASKVQDYWTPERMKNAIPLDAPDPGTPPSGSAGPAAAPTGEPGSTEPVAPTVPGRAGLREPLINESAAVGKVFFTDPSDGKDHVCSGSALNSPSRQLVITAGSCVHGGQGKTWMTNWIYAPRYRSSSYPFGTYAAKQFRAFDAWMSSSAPSRNVGLVTTWPQNGTRLVDATGGQGLSWNYPQNVDVTALTYSLDRSDGEIQQWCTGTTARGYFSGTIGLYCSLGTRSPGGPWLREFDNSTGLGHVNGVMSAIDCSDWNQSSYFDDGVKSMVDAQGSVT
ncbi:hypothetical protein ABH930_000379 [Kitasatospora sp. GAS204A]|nr:hypothetical protein [Kitasatospora sp. GAS204B]